MRSIASADAVPRIVASTAVIDAIVRLLPSDSMRNRSDHASAYHFVEKPSSSVTWRPALNEYTTTMRIGRNRNAKTRAV